MTDTTANKGPSEARSPAGHPETPQATDGPYRFRHPHTFVEPETADPVRAVAVAEEQAQTARKRVAGILEALTRHDAHGQLLTQEWGLAVVELGEARAHLAETLARWANDVIPCDPSTLEPTE